MGQISLPAINRTGMSSHWASSGDSTFNKSNLFSKDFYLRLIVKLIYKSHSPFYEFSIDNEVVPNDLLLLEVDKVNKFNYKRSNGDKFVLFELSDSYKESIVDYRLNKSLRYEAFIEKFLPIYNGNLLIIKDNSNIFIAVRYFTIIRSNWHKQVNDLVLKRRVRSRSNKFNVYRKKFPKKLNSHNDFNLKPSNLKYF